VPVLGHYNPNVALDLTSQLRKGASVDVFLPGTTTRPTIYTTSAGTLAKANPIITDATTGGFDFYAPPGFYDIVIAGTTYRISIVGPAGSSVSASALFTKGDDSTDNTTQLQAALNAGSVYTHTPSGGAGMGSVSSIHLEPGVYRISDTLTLPSYCRIFCPGRAVIRQMDSTKDILYTATGYMLDLDGVCLSGGKRQIAFGNNNTNTSMVSIRNGELASNNADFAIDLFAVAPATNLSAVVTIERCKIVNPYKTLRNAYGCSVRVNDTWLQTGDNSADGAQFENHDELTLDRLYTVPGASSPTTNMRWIDNYSKVYANHCRFGGEYSGIPTVYNYAPISTAYPYDQGGVVSIRNSPILAIGGTGTTGCLIRLFQLPQLIEVADNSAVTRDSNPWIIDNISGGVAAAITAINVYSFAGLKAYNNAGLLYLDETGIPAAMLANQGKYRVMIESTHLYTNCVVRGATGLAASRPAASDAGAAGQFFNTTTGKLNISTGSAWVHADGSAA